MRISPLLRAGFRIMVPKLHHYRFANLQTKKGLRAVPYLKEAARLGQADAHLRLATLYNAAGLKSEAAG